MEYPNYAQNFNSGLLYTSLKAVLSFRPDHLALYYQDNVITNQEFLRRIDEVAQALITDGIHEKEVVMLALPNIPEAIVCLYALNKIGAISFLVNPVIPLNKIKKWVDDYNISVILTTPKNTSELSPLVGDNKHQIIVCSGEDEHTSWLKLFKKKEKYPVHPLIQSYNEFVKKSDKIEHPIKDKRAINFDNIMPAVLMTSGGTMGEAKVISLSNQAINAFSKKLSTLVHPLNLTEEYVLALMPLYHGLGLGVCIHGALISGASLCLMEKFHPTEVLKDIKEGHASILVGVPTVYKALMVSKDLNQEVIKHIHAAFVGGDFMNPDDIKSINQIFRDYHSNVRLNEGYGLTETVAAVTANTAKSYREGSIGKALPGIKVKIVDQSTGEECNTDICGEICVCSDTLMSEYPFDEKATNHAIHYENGRNWLHTGDYGYIDSDGYVYFKQRIKRVIKVSGITVCPSDIETLVEKIESIDTAIAIETPDEQKGSMINLFIKVKDFSLEKDEFRLNKLKAIINDIIKAESSIYAVPKEIIVIHDIPHTAIGKIDYRSLEQFNKH